MVLAYAGVRFKTYSGLPFTYEIKKGRNGEYTEELWIDRREKSKSLSWSSVLLLCKQFFAAAHELYHIYCYVEDADQSYIKNGSMLDSGTANEMGKTQEDVAKRVELTGKAKRWQLDGSGTESFGTLLEKADYNTEHDYLTESREKEDWKYISELKKELGMD